MQRYPRQNMGNLMLSELKTKLILMLSQDLRKELMQMQI